MNIFVIRKCLLLYRIEFNRELERVFVEGDKKPHWRKFILGGEGILCSKECIVSKFLCSQPHNYQDLGNGRREPWKKKEQVIHVFLN